MAMKATPGPCLKERPMTRLAHFGILAALTLGVVLLAQVVSAAPRPHPAPLSANFAQQGSLDILGRFWTSLTGLWRSAGCSIDPDGRCGNPSSSIARGSSGENGCSIDPNGIHCASSQRAVLPRDAGCSLDPDGTRCVGSPRLTPAADNGCSLDPDGRCMR
jgi:hypothetical protein